MRTAFVLVLASLAVACDPKGTCLSQNTVGKQTVSLCVVNDTESSCDPSHSNGTRQFFKEGVSASQTHCQGLGFTKPMLDMGESEADFDNKVKAGERKTYSN